MSRNKNQEKLELFADVLEHVAVFLADREVVELFQKGGIYQISAVAKAIKNHPREAEELCAAIEGVPIEGYEIDESALLTKLVNMLNKPILNDLFSSQVQMKGGAVSGLATENIKDGVN